MPPADQRNLGNIWVRLCAERLAQDVSPQSCCVMVYLSRQANVTSLYTLRFIGLHEMDRL
jgi:hypothetical protein